MSGSCRIQMMLKMVKWFCCQQTARTKTVLKTRATYIIRDTMLEIKTKICSTNQASAAGSCKWAETELT